MARQPNAPSPTNVSTVSLAHGHVLAAIAAEIERRSSDLGDAVGLDWQQELALRGRLLGMWPEARVSASGACRILRASDQWIALSVTRPWDHEVLPALVEGPVGQDHWSNLSAWAARRTAAEAVGRARLLDLAAATLDSIPPSTPVPLAVTRPWASGGRRRVKRTTVVDLSSLWAGPLVARILAEAGATVVKVESSTRPDGARAVPDFYRALHGEGDHQVQVDLSTDRGRSHLRQLIEEADVVIEASRPRALEQLGVGPDQIASRRGRVWLSITGYGRTGPGAQWIAFGDDAAVAGGLVDRSKDGTPAFAADAVADPVSGLFGAAAVLRSLAQGGGHLIDLALSGSAAAVARGVQPLGSEE